ncbi:uncharacterized protein [Nicotiana sylvestris]|uniref:uncharacterized protein n=1 Tax=Nicotiana sylvestris TaxID=4096 RepID=UPI00388C6046
MVVPSSEYVLPEVGSPGAGRTNRSVLCFEKARRLHFTAFDMIRSELLHQGARLRNALEKGDPLRLLSKDKEVKLMHWRYEAYRSSNHESYLTEQLQKKTEALEYLKGEADHVRNACGELRAQVQAQALEEKSASAKVTAFEVQLRLARDNGLVKEDMITKLETDLSKVRTEITDARAEALLNRNRADQEMAIHVKDVADAQAELKWALDREKRIEEYVRCKSRREVLEEVGAMVFVLSKELARVWEDERDARLLLADASESESGASRP